MRDKAMDLRVQSAVLSNRLVMLDNPLRRDKITRLKAEAMEALRTNAALWAEVLPETAAAAAVREADPGAAQGPAAALGSDAASGSDVAAATAGQGAPLDVSMR